MSATTPTSWRAVDPLLRIAGLIATLALPVLLITLVARVVIFSPLLYEYGFRRYGIEFVTLIPYDELLKASEETRTYFDAPGKEPLHIVVQREGKPFELYNQREVAHMADVKLLVQGVDQLRKASLAILLATLGIGLVLGKRAYLGRFGGVLFRGGLLTVAIGVVAGVGSLFDFDQLFLQFHMLSFSNDLWMLNPRTDFLLMMYPSEFFRDATLGIGGFALLFATACMAVGAVLMPRQVRRTPLPATAATDERDRDPATLLADIDSTIEGLAGWYGSALYPEGVELGEGGWSARQMLAHLVFWHETTATSIAIVASGAPAPTVGSDFDALNAAAVAQWESQAIPDLLADLRTAQAKLRQAAFAVPGPDTIVRVRPDGVQRTLAEQLAITRNHLQEHLTELRTATMAGAGG